MPKHKKINGLADLVSQLRRHHPHLSLRQCRLVCATVIEALSDALSLGEPVSIAGFGRFSLSHPTRDPLFVTAAAFQQQLLTHTLPDLRFPTIKPAPYIPPPDLALARTLLKSTRHLARAHHLPPTPRSHPTTPKRNARTSRLLTEHYRRLSLPPPPAPPVITPYPLPLAVQGQSPRTLMESRMAKAILALLPPQTP